MHLLVSFNHQYTPSLFRYFGDEKCKYLFEWNREQTCAHTHTQMGKLEQSKETDDTKNIYINEKPKSK